MRFLAVAALCCFLLGCSAGAGPADASPSPTITLSSSPQAQPEASYEGNILQDARLEDVLVLSEIALQALYELDLDAMGDEIGEEFAQRALGIGAYRGAINTRQQPVQAYEALFSPPAPTAIAWQQYSPVPERITLMARAFTGRGESEDAFVLSGTVYITDEQGDATPLYDADCFFLIARDKPYGYVLSGITIY